MSCRDVRVGRRGVGPSESKSTGQCCGDFRPGDVPVRLERPVRITDEERLVIYRGRRRRHNGWRHNGWRYNRWRHNGWRYNGWRYNRWRYNRWRYNRWRYNRWRRSDVVGEGGRAGPVDVNDDVHRRITGSNPSSMQSALDHGVRTGDDRNSVIAKTAIRGDVKRRYIVHTTGDGEVKGAIATSCVLDDLQRTHGSVGEIDRGTDGAIIRHGGKLHHVNVIGDPAGGLGAFGHGIGDSGGDGNRVGACADIGGDVEVRHNVQTVGDGEVERAVTTDRVLDVSDGGPGDN